VPTYLRLQPPLIRMSSSTSTSRQPYAFDYNWKPATVEMAASDLLKSWGFDDNVVYTQNQKDADCYTAAVPLKIQTIKDRMEELGFLLDTPIVDRDGLRLQFVILYDGAPVDGKDCHLARSSIHVKKRNWDDFKEKEDSIWLEAEFWLQRKAPLFRYLMGQ